MELNPYEPSREPGVRPKRSEWRGAFFRGLIVAVVSFAVVIGIMVTALELSVDLKRPGRLRSAAIWALLISFAGVASMVVASVLWFVTWLLNRRREP
jgi:hypothetical protein